MSSESPPTLETADCDKLLDFLRYNAGTANKMRNAVRNYCMALLMLDAGLRVGELVSLRVSNLYFNREPVRNIIIKPHMTKNKVEHSIPVSELLSAALVIFFDIWWLNYETLEQKFAFVSSKREHPITTRQVERIICAAGWKVLGRPVHPHVLRHTFASRLMRVTNSSTVQQMLGHKYLSSTQVYCHPNEDDKRLAIDSASKAPEHLPTPEQQPPQPSNPAEPMHPGPLPASPSRAQPASHW
ncbi:Tyrosine recombinase XerC [subsurface metagenome]